jgi:hypothetical protein
MRRAGRLPTPSLAAKDPRMRRGGRLQTPSLAAKDPKRRAVTGPRTLLAMMGAPADTMRE